MTIFGWRLSLGFRREASSRTWEIAVSRSRGDRVEREWRFARVTLQ